MAMPQNAFSLTCRDIALVTAESYVAWDIVDVSAWEGVARSSKENPSSDLHIPPGLLLILLLLATNKTSQRPSS